MNYARVFFEIPLNRGFDYRIPEIFLGKISKGMRVLAPFGRERKLGYVWELISEPEVKDVKDIFEVKDDVSIFNPALLQLAEWMSDYYFCPLGLTLKTMLPAPIRNFRSPKRKLKPLPLLEETLETPFLLNEEQGLAQSLIFEKMRGGNFSVILIHGVTGSGKTELYLSAIAKALSEGKGAIVLVPEISLTPQTVERVRKRFGQSVSLLHSRMSERERFEAWDQIRNGDSKVVVGPRSAVFAPVQNLGLIIVDEEHERSYKQEESPRYHARDIAVMRAKFERALVLLGSATPALESYYNAQKGRYQLITLLKRVEDRPLPKVRVVDMRQEVERSGKLYSFSHVLIEMIQKTLEKKEQTLLFLNRRGYAPTVLCPKCGHIFNCSECDQAMTYHQTKEILMCHLCEAQKPIPKNCPKCSFKTFHRLGVGTQRVEKHLEKFFSRAAIQRMDTDSTRKKDAHINILEAFREGKTEILVGTQMIAKGLDFPNVTLVGVMSADIAMSLPDFRMGEHTFQLLTQVAGRAGRGSKLGEVLIQTFTPFHPIIRSALSQDYLAFYQSELAYRKELGYPPFSKLMAIQFDGKEESNVFRTARAMLERLQAGSIESLRILGPHRSPISKLKGRYRWQMILFYAREKPIHQSIRSILDNFKCEKGVRIALDVDPVSLI
ncbi:MAG: primosomal protein N' [Chlamydiae bacterium]|nr:primosomal protein N' [Chlamydiota bacterium]MBI3277194.1 primosomal protein N' [Chlamydiota bacterium]